MMMLFNLGWPRLAASSPRAPQEGYAVTRPRIGLALGSGAARGLAHIGVIDALVDAGIEPDIVCGTSIGALVGAAHVAGKLAELRQWAETATWRKILRLTDLRLTGGGLISGRQVVAFLQGLGIGEPIESYATHYAAVATDWPPGREIWLQTGPIHEAVRASIALPGILSPARMDGKWLLDGGLSNPIPVSVCRALGADVIIAVNLNGELLGRRFAEPEPPAEGVTASLPGEVVAAHPRSLAGKAAAGSAAQGSEGRSSRPAGRDLAGAGLFRRARHRHQHHAGPHHPHAPGRRAAACAAGAAVARHRPDGIQPRRRGNRRRPRLRRAGAADAAAVSLASAGNEHWPTFQHPRCDDLPSDVGVANGQR